MPVAARRTDPLPASRAVAGGRPRRRRPATDRRPPEPEGTRARLVTAAAAEFAAHGFAGANVDRIAARRPRQQGDDLLPLPQQGGALPRDSRRHVPRRLRPRPRRCRLRGRRRKTRSGGFIDAIAAEAQARPHFPPTWFREIAEGGRHLDEAHPRATLPRIVGTLDGDHRARASAARRFRPVNPLLVHGGIVAPVLLFFASDRLRKRLGKAGTANARAQSPTTKWSRTFMR